METIPDRIAGTRYPAGIFPPDIQYGDPFIALARPRIDPGRSIALLHSRFTTTGVFFYDRRNMSDQVLQRFVKSYAPGAVICREGEQGVEMYIIQKGKVRVSKDFAGKTHVVSVLEKGDFFGEMAIVTRIQRTATVTALEPVELLAFDRDGLESMIARNARIALSIIDRLCRRLQNAHLKIQHLVKKDAGGLIALHLRYLFQELPSGQFSVPFQRTLEDISLSLELPMEEVKVSLERLHGAGIIGVAADSIVLADREKLERMTESLGREPGEAARSPAD
jgi:CRP-like cAMP-binding protein